MGRIRSAQTWPVGVSAEEKFQIDLAWGAKIWVTEKGEDDVEIEPDELDAVEVEATHTIDIEKFVPREYWSLVATLLTPRGDAFEARLVGADGKKIQRLDIGSGAEAEAFKRALEDAAFTVANVEAKPARRNPPPPFTTSTLQQEAARKLGFSASHTMQVVSSSTMMPVPTRIEVPLSLGTITILRVG